MADKSEAIEKAVVTLHQLSEDKKIKLQCEARERYWMDWQSSMRTEKDRADSEKARADKIEAQKQSMLLEIERLKRLLEKGQE